MTDVTKTLRDAHRWAETVRGVRWLLFGISWVALAGSGLRAEGELTALGWGRDDSGQLGLGTKVVFQTPTVVPQTGLLAGKVITKTVAGRNHVLALTADQKVYAWGDNNHCQLANTSFLPSSTPFEVPLPAGLAGKTIIDLAVTLNASYLLTADFQLWGWGDGPFGWVANETKNSPFRIDAGALNGKKVVKIVCGTNHLLALTADGLVVSMGGNNNGQLGDNTSTSRFTPVQIADPNNNLHGRTVADIAAGPLCSMLRTSDGALFSWGSNTNGQLGVGDKVNRLVPTPVDGTLMGRSVRAMAIGFYNGYAITNDNQLHSWGFNSARGLAIGTSTPSERLVPGLATMTNFLGETLVEVHSGNQCGAVRTASGKVFTWGASSRGVLGRGDPAVSGSGVGLVSFAGLGGVVLVRSLNVDGWGRMSAILADGRVTQWGSGLFGRAGNGQPYWRAAPETVPTSALLFNETWKILAARQTISVGVSPGGKVFSWGTEGLGQGSGVTVSSNPQLVQSGGLLNNKVVTAVSLGDGHRIVLSSDGEVFAWGSGASGQLGDGTFQNIVRSNAAQVVTTGTPMAGKTVTQIAAGSNHTLALTSDGQVFAWGLNSEGQLGDTTQTSRNLPTAVTKSGALAGKTVVAIAAGSNASYALTSDGQVFAWGSNISGRLGTGEGSPAIRTTPAAVVMDGQMTGKTIVHIAAGNASAYAISTDGSLFGWGQNVNGSGFNEVPVAISLPSGDTHRVPVAVAANGTCMHVLTTDGAVFSSGNSRFGALGLGSLDQTAAWQLQRVPGTGRAEGLKVLSIATAGRAEHVLATAERGTPELIVESPVGTALPRDSAMVSFGEVAAGTTVQRTLRLIYSGEDDITLLGFSLFPESPHFSCGDTFPAVLSKGQSLDVVIEFTAPSRGGPYRFKASLMVERPHHDLFEAEIDFEIDLTVQVLGPVPSLVKQPQSQIVAEGSTAMLAVEAFGLPPLSYQWRYKGKNLPGATSAALEFSAVSLNHAGDYSVVVKSGESVESLPANLSVVRFVGGSRVLKAGTATAFTIKAAGIGLSYQWFRNGLPLPEDPRIRGVTATTLRIQSLAADSSVDSVGHSGTYTCQVSQLGSESFSAGTVALLVTDLRPRFLLPVDPPSAAIGVDYEFGISMDPNPRRTASKFSARGLPKGLTINPQTGVISGRPIQLRVGGFQVVLTAENREGRIHHPTVLDVRSLPPGSTGSFAAVFEPSAQLNQELGGKMDLTINDSGALSGRVWLGLKRHRFKGSVNASHSTPLVSATLALPRRGSSPLELEFSIDDREADPLSGQLRDPDLVAAVASMSGWNLPWSRNLPATAFIGLHNVLLAAPASEIETPEVPRGQGFASFTPSRLGKFRLIGKLADGQGFALSAAVGASGQMAVHQLLYRGPWRGSLSGRLGVTSGAPQLSPLDNRVDGTLRWTRPADATGRSLLYPSGFRLLELEAVGSGYVPVSGGVLLDLVAPNNEALLDFRAARLVDLATSPTTLTRLLPKNRVELPVPNPTATTLRTSVNKGTFNGSFRLSDNGQSRNAKFQGVVIHGDNGHYGAGFFLLPELGVPRPLMLSGEVSLQKTDPAP